MDNQSQVVYGTTTHFRDTVGNSNMAYAYGFRVPVTPPQKCPLSKSEKKFARNDELNDRVKRNLNRKFKFKTVTVV